MIKAGSFISGLVGLLLLPVLLSCSGQNGRLETEGLKQLESSQITDDQPFMDLKELSYDFGTIIEGEKVVCYFDYENTGNTELVISSVSSTCGCTTPDWSSEPLMPGERKSMQIIFDATGRSGLQRKVVTVLSNASNSPVKLTIKANIET